MLATLCNEHVMKIIVVLYYLWNNNKKNVCVCSRDEKYLVVLFDVVLGVKSRDLYTLGKCCTMNLYLQIFYIIFLIQIG